MNKRETQPLKYVSENFDYTFYKDEDACESIL